MSPGGTSLAVVGVYMPGMPPIGSAPPPAITGGSSSRISVIRQLVVSTDAAIEHELMIACCVTVAGSITPISKRSPYSPLAAFQPYPNSLSFTFSRTSAPSSPALKAIWLIGYWIRAGEGWRGQRCGKERGCGA